MDILSRLKNKMPELSRGQKRIALQIQQGCDKTAFLTAQGLGGLAGVSEATVVRFAAELGYEGYPQMQRAMQAAVMNRMTEPEEIRDTLSTALQSDMESLRKTNAAIDRAAFDEAVQDIRKAKCIYILGVRQDAALAVFLGYSLHRLFPGVHIVTDSTSADAIEKLFYLSPQDCVIAFSFPRHCTAPLETAAYCHRVGAKVIGITNSIATPFAEACDRILTCPTDRANSLAAPMSLLSALITALAEGKEDTTQRWESLWQTCHVYEDTL